jgi:hypothetical protein
MGNPFSRTVGVSTTMWFSLFMSTLVISLCLCVAAVMLEAEG